MIPSATIVKSVYALELVCVCWETIDKIWCQLDRSLLIGICSIITVDAAVWCVREGHEGHSVVREIVLFLGCGDIPKYRQTIAGMIDFFGCPKRVRPTTV